MAASVAHPGDESFLTGSQVPPVWQTCMWTVPRISNVFGSTPAVSSIGAYQVTWPSCSSTLMLVSKCGPFSMRVVGAGCERNALSWRKSGDGCRSIVVGSGPPGVA